MKIEAFLNDEEMKDVKAFIKELIKKNARETDEIGSGGLTVVVENKGNDGWLFSVNRTIAYVTVKKLSGNIGKRSKPFPEGRGTGDSQMFKALNEPCTSEDNIGQFPPKNIKPSRQKKAKPVIMDEEDRHLAYLEERESNRQKKAKEEKAK